MLIKFHLKLAIKSILARKRYNLISVLSLSLAFVSVLLIAFWVVKEINYDRHFAKHQRIHRLTLEIKTPDGYEAHFARVAQRWVQQVGEFIPEIKSTVRFAPKRFTRVRIGEHKFATDNIFETDTSVFSVFDLELLEGDKSSALHAPFCVVLSKSIADTYFDGGSPIGQYVSLIGQNDYEQKKYLVTGVYQDFPSATHFHPEMLLSFEDPNNFGWAYFYLYLHKGTKPDLLQAKLDDYIIQKTEPETAANYSLHFQPIHQIHLYSAKDREIELNGNIQSIFILSGIAMMILFIALFNYINLNVAQLFREIRFLIINKVYGASSRSIFMFQLIKSVLVALFSTLLSILITFLLLALINENIQEGLFPPDDLANVWLSTLLILFVLAVIAGTIPSFYFILTRFSRGMLLRSNSLVQLFRPQKKFILRKVLIGFQLCISIVLILLTAFAGLQMNFLSSKWMGNNPDEHILVIENLSHSIRPKYPEFRTEILKSPYVLDLTALMEVPPSPIKDAFEFDADSPEKNENLIVYVGPVADNFFKFYDQNIIFGSDFPDYIQGQEFESYILNETAAGLLGWKNPAEAIGKSFKINFISEGLFYGGKIVGIVEDFHQTSLHHKIVPTVYFQQPAFYLSFLIKIKNQDTPQALNHIEKTWNDLFPEHPFIFTFQKELYNSAYEREILQARLTGFFTLLAIVITLIGLIGITTILTAQRTREIGIRIVLGAGLTRVLAKMAQEIIIVLIVSIAVAIPLAIYLVEQWLNNFAYAILVENYWWIPLTISLAYFILIAAIVVIIVLFTVRKNPIDSLKWE